MRDSAISSTVLAKNDKVPEILSCGFCSFMGVAMKVSSGVFVPRGETELLGFTALELIEDIPKPLIIDMCTGSGNLACALATKLPAVKVWAVDATRECIALLKENICHLSLQSRVIPIQSDLFSALLRSDIEGSIDLVVCNPPYIPARRLETDRKALLDHEPREAFQAGPYGISIIQRVIRHAAILLRPGRPLCFEFGTGQEGIVARLLEQSDMYGAIRFVADQSGVPRVVVAYKR